LLSNPRADPGYYSVPKLLRRTAVHLEKLGDDETVRDLLLEWKEYLDPQTYEFDETLGPGVAVYWPDRCEAPLPDPMNYFSMTNPKEEPDRRSVPKLLRRVADHLDELGDDAVVFRLILHTEPAGAGSTHSANTYYSREDGWTQNFDPQAHDLLLE
jgi:hypothetical protein